MKLHEDLRRSVLQAAIEGKLTTQRPEDGTAEDLLRDIRREKARLIADGKLKREKELAAVRGDEVPFDIPESWRWVRLGEIIINDIGGGTPDKGVAEYWAGNIPWMSVKDFARAKNGFIEDTTDHISEEGIKHSATNLITPGAIIICMRMGLGKYARLKQPTAINQDLRAIWFSHHVSEDYVLHWYSTIKIEGTGTTVKGIKRQELFAYPIPLPPLAEQHRIASKLEALMSKLDELADLEDELETLTKRFPTDMRDSLLQAAIQGKLTRQRPEDGTAEDLLRDIRREKERLVAEGRLKREKELPAVRGDEVPFEIPDSWRWVRLGEICSKIIDGNHNPPQGLSVKTDYMMLSAQNVNFNSLVNLEQVRYLSKETFEKENKRTRLEAGDILFTIVGTLGRSCVYQGGMSICFQRSVSVITPLINSSFLKFALDTPYIQNHMVQNATGTAQKGFYLNKVVELLIPLPPLPEQQRIVKRLNQLLPLCDSMSNAINSQ